MSRNKFISKKLLHWAIWGFGWIMLLASTADSSPFSSNTLRLAQAFPKGAIAYLQAKDLATLSEKWKQSATHKEYFASKNYKAFQSSRLYIKLQERLKEFEEGSGFSFTEENIQNLAGKESAVAMYDMGKLEIVYCTEMPLAQAKTSIFYQQSAKFDLRKHGEIEYYSQELSTDGGRQLQNLCFASLDGKFIITTTELLMHRTLDNLSHTLPLGNSDYLLESIEPTLKISNGFVPHDLTLWTDVVRLKEQKYFGLYWIQDKNNSLENISGTLTDIEISRSGAFEHRWSLLKQESINPVKIQTSKPLSDLTRFVPNNTQFVDIRTIYSSKDFESLNSLITKLLFPIVSPPSLLSLPSPPVYLTNNDDASNYGRYRILDDRFDQDIDDPATALNKKKDSSKLKQRSNEVIAKDLKEILTNTHPIRFINLGTQQLEKPFVWLDRGVIVEMQTDLNVTTFEKVLAENFQQRLLVKGFTSSMAWTTQLGVRTLSSNVAEKNNLIEQNISYCLQGKFLVIANTSNYCRSVIQSYQAKKLLPFKFELENSDHFAWVNLKEGAIQYQKLMHQLDFNDIESSEDLANSDSNSEDLDDSDLNSDKPIKFFSENLGSLLGVINYVKNITVESSIRGSSKEERVKYLFTSN